MMQFDPPLSSRALSIGKSAAMTWLLAFLTGCAATEAASTPPPPSSHPSAKRSAPLEISPVTLGGVRFEVVHWGLARGLPQNGGYLAAIDESSGRELWLLQVYDATQDPRRERDVQDVFVTRLAASPAGDRLEVTDESGRHYLVDPVSRTARRR